MIFDYLGILSFFPILKIYRKSGVTKIYYLNASWFGLKVIRILRFFEVVLDGSCQIKDPVMIDSPHTKLFESYISGFKICHAKQKKIEETVDTFFFGFSKYSKDLLVMGVKSTWIFYLANIFWLQNFAEHKAEKLNISTDRVVVVSRYASLMKELKPGILFLFPPSPVLVIQQAFQNSVLPLLCRSFFWSLRGIFYPLFAYGKSFTSKLKTNNLLPKIAATAVWGIKIAPRSSILDDLFWWKSSGIPCQRLAYIYDRPNYQPTAERTKVTDSLGIQSFVSDFRFSGNSPQLLLDKIAQKSFWGSLVEVFHVIKWSFRVLFLETLPQSVVAINSCHFVQATRLTTYFKALNIRGVVHYQQTSIDINSLAAELSGACRFGILWSCLHCYSDVLATSQVLFVWGANDAKLLLDQGCISKHLLVAGCLVDKPAEEKNQKKYLSMVDQMHNQGANYVLALFPHSSLSKDFYSFFFNWVMEDPHLGLLIKNKGNLWSDIHTDGLNGLVQKVLSTGRVQIVDYSESPADVAEAVDFSIGIGTYSAVVVSALKGARVLFVDNERLDQGKCKQPYYLLHSLGHNRCVFYEFDSVKRAILQYINDPESNPHLGDVSSILDLIDPFQDGRANERVGKYMGWYLEGLDNGLSRDDSLKLATKSYSQKWGEDKVVLGLD
jgi:hypothetical protein